MSLGACARAVFTEASHSGYQPGPIGGGSGTVRVLVVEDERPLADALVRGLRREGMAVDV
jgi:hypothetical protein